jgi:hypothetical protein
MRSSYTGRKAVYYYVTSGNGRASGIVWRGYLTAGVNSGTSTMPSTGSSSSSDGSNSTGNSSSSTNAGTDTGSSSSSTSSSSSASTSAPTYSTDSTQFNAKDVASFNKQIIQLFPGLIEDSKLDDMASYILKLQDKYNYGDMQTLSDKHRTQLYGGEPYGLLEDWNAVTIPDINLVKKQVVSPLNEINYLNLSGYAGYHIGVASQAEANSSNGGKISKINYYIYILPANPKITPVP